jgi:hypothetical protein
MQLDLFLEPPVSTSTSSSPSASPIVGMKVQLPKACTCGSHLGVIGSSTGPHAKRVTCDSCGTFRQWLGRAEAAFVTEVSAKFGCPPAPIVLRGAV